MRENVKPFALCFRVEDPKGVGMYSGPFRHHLQPCAGFDHRPGPYDDGLGAWDRDPDWGQFHFGFQTIERLNEWLGDVFEEAEIYDAWEGQWLGGNHAKKSLTAAQLAISIYLTDDYYMGHRQMCFRRCTAKLVGRLPVLSLKETQACHALQTSKLSPNSPCPVKTTTGNRSRLSTELLKRNLPPRSVDIRRSRLAEAGSMKMASWSRKMARLTKLR